MKRLLPLLLLLALAACRPKPAAPPPASAEPLVDSQLRGLLGVHTLVGAYELPPGEDYYLITPLEIEDGKIVRWDASFSGSVEQIKTRKLDLQFLWGEVNGKMKQTLWHDGSVCSSQSDFWKAFEQGNCSHNYTKGEKPPVFEGYAILAFVASPIRRDGNPKVSYSGEFPFELREKKEIGALAVKTFKTKEALDEAGRALMGAPPQVP